MKFPQKVENNYDNEIYFTYYDEHRVLHHDIVKTFKNYFYTSTVGKNFLEQKLATRRYVEQFGDMKFEMKKYPFTYEADFSAAKRFLLDGFYTHDTLPQFDGPRVAIIDIENDYKGKMCFEGEYAVTAISIYDSWTKRVYTFGWHPEIQWSSKEDLTLVFKTEAEMMETFLKFWTNMGFVTVTGWNVNYDITYLGNRLEKIFKCVERLSPYNIVTKRKKDGTYAITGVNVVDYMEAYKKFATKTLPSLKLDYVCNEELKEGKVAYVGDLKTLWKNDPRRYIAYNKKDVELVAALDAKLQFLSLMDQVRCFGFINLEDSMKFSMTIDNMIIQKAMRAQFVVKSKVYGEAQPAPEEGETDDVQGAYNYDDFQFGYHPWILDMDATSMYPFIIMNLNISPETKDDAGDVVAGNGQHFTSKFKGVVPQILQWMFDERVKYKDLMKAAMKRGDEEDRLRNANKQASVKKILNSFYGVSASKFFRFYDKRIAEAVTLTGQKLIKHALGFVQNMGYKVITGDTDSVLFTAGADCDVARAKVIMKTVGEAIDNSLTEFCKTNFNIDKQNFHFKGEMVADAGIFIAKKHYVMHKVNIEGIDCDEMEFKGIDIVRNDTPKICKTHLKAIYEGFVRGKTIDELQVMIQDYRNYILNAPIAEVMIPTSLSKDLAEYTKTQPIHVRGARYWETHYAEKYGVSFADTNRGRFVYVKMTDDRLPETNVVTVPDGCDGFQFVGMVPDYDLILERLFNKKLEDIYFVIRVEELRKWIAEGLDDQVVFARIYDKMVAGNPEMWSLPKIKYNVIVREFSREWWEQYLELRKIRVAEFKKSYVEYVQARVEALQEEPEFGPKKTKKPRKTKKLSVVVVTETVEVERTTTVTVTEGDMDISEIAAEDSAAREPDVDVPEEEDLPAAEMAEFSRECEAESQAIHREEQSAELEAPESRTLLTADEIGGLY